MTKIKLWDTKNVIVTFKGIVSNIMTSLVIVLPLMLGRWLVLTKEMVGLGRGVQVLALLSTLLFWGYFSRRFWNWK